MCLPRSVAAEHALPQMPSLATNSVGEYIDSEWHLLWWHMLWWHMLWWHMLWTSLPLVLSFLYGCQ